MSPEAALRTRVVLGLALVLGPILPVFQTGRYSTMRGAVITIAGSVIAVLFGWFARKDPELPPHWFRLWIAGIVGGLLVSVIVALALGANFPTIVQFLWIPLLRSMAVSWGVCLMLSAAEPMRVPPPMDEGMNPQPTLPRSS